MSEPLLQVANATKRFNVRHSPFRRSRITALDDVSLDVAEGETIGLVGESGCGKSTMGRCILHLVLLDGGAIRFRGREVQGLPEREFRPLRREVQMVFQNPRTSFNPALTIGQSLVDAMRLRNELAAGDKMTYALEMLDRVQLSPRFVMQFPRETSGGELQRVALARALVVAPKFIFLDEPTSALDMSIRGQIVNLLLDIQERDRLAYIFVSHDLLLIKYVANVIYVMYKGQIVETGTRDEIFESPLHPYTRALLAATLVGRKQRRETRRHSLRGEVAGERWSGAGCKLYPRCAEALERCATESQALVTLYPGRQVRCWRAQEASGGP
jgi:peptide/nickel transport system ATP-binding protein